MGRLGGPEELGFDESLLSSNEVWGQRSFGICTTLVSELSFGNSSFQFLVEFVQINN